MEMAASLVLEVLNGNGGLGRAQAEVFAVGYPRIVDGVVAVEKAGAVEVEEILKTLLRLLGLGNSGGDRGGKQTDHRDQPRRKSVETVMVSSRVVLPKCIREWIGVVPLNCPTLGYPRPGCVRQDPSLPGV